MAIAASPGGAPALRGKEDRGAVCRPRSLPPLHATEKQAMPSSLDILLVEDSDLLRPITEEYLLELGHKVVAVADAEQALKQLADQGFDALMTDVRLPGMSGIALVREVTQRYPRMAIVVSSGASEMTAEILGNELGAVISVLPKPYDMDTMKRVLEEARLRIEAG